MYEELEKENKRLYITLFLLTFSFIAFASISLAHLTNSGDRGLTPINYTKEKQ